MANRQLVLGSSKLSISWDGQVLNPEKKPHLKTTSCVRKPGLQWAEMTSKYSYILKVYEAKTASPDPVPNPGCNIELHIRYRYQLKIPSNEGTMAVIEDLITPEQRTTLRIPVFFPLARWRELYLSDVLLPTNLDINMRNILNPRVSKAIASVAERNGNKGFDIVVKVGILKAETMSKEEVSGIAARLAKMEVSADSLQSPAPQLVVIDETEACMSNAEDLEFVS